MSPERAAERRKQLGAALDAQSGYEQPVVQATDPGMRAAQREARAFISDPAYRNFRVVLRTLAHGNLEPQPLLGPCPGATLSEYAVFRAGVRAMYDVTAILSRQATQEDETHELVE